MNTTCQGRREVAGQQGKGYASPPGPIVVQLPDLPSVPAVWRGAKYVVRSLLGSGDANPKLRKSNLANSDFQTWGLALSPAKQSGIQTCASSTSGCRKVCLFHQGHARIDASIAACRIAKTMAFKTHRDWFVARLSHELARLRKRAQERRFRIAIRLNLTSDVAWEQELPDIFEQFAEIQFYDYTKTVKRMMKFINGDFPANYHLTFSRSEDNELAAHDVLMAGGNVAVVFRNRPFPERYLGFKVIDGDVTDLRFLDPRGVVVALSAKGTAKNDDSGFVVDSFRWPLL